MAKKKEKSGMGSVFPSGPTGPSTNPPVTKSKIKKAPVKVLAHLESFTLEITVSTGAYSNVKAIITVKAETLGEAMDYAIVPVRKLHQDFFLMTERRVSEAKVEVKETVVDQKPIEPTKVLVNGEPTGMVVEVSEAFKKAYKVVEEALNVDALEVVIGQITKSAKLFPLEKDQLTNAALLKIKEINK